MKRLKYMLLFFFLIINSYQLHADNTIHMQLDSAEDWKIKHFQNKNDFKITFEDSEPILTIKSINASAIFYRKININLKETPYLNWSWRIDRIFNNKNEQKRLGDDFPARVLVAFNKGFFGAESVGFSFVWASKNKKGTTWPSPIKENLLMHVNQAGKHRLNKWTDEKIDLRRAFKTHFDRVLHKVNYIALIADTDDLNESVTTQFKKIYFSSQ